ncbi:acetate/propionate family kinase [Edaphobacter bradus]|uniref:acetate/propionate family kinase n=1 Tax=Edaphobacter bradus TaxID=2259016 RepID=UPI0021DF7946|nr:acetate/propionate family kinase [Edaphobacter bradus]
MHILVINSGSSSIKFSVYSAGGAEPQSMFEGEVSGIGSGKASLKFRDAAGRDLTGGSPEVKAENPVEAIGVVERALNSGAMPQIDAVGYRVVHPGPKLKRHVRLSDEVMRDLKEAAEFAPLHDPVAIEMIEDAMQRIPRAAHYACFDTVFHETMPEAASTYALPEKYREQGVRRYGFHGLSCESVVRQLRTAGIRLPQRMVIAHLGSGCSVTALLAGRSIDTTMGLTPTGGVVMGTRPGDLDPGLVLYLLRKMNGDAELERMLNRDAGMVGLTGLPNDMKMVREGAAKGDSRAQLAIEVFTRSVRKAIGGFSWLMGGLDAVVFAGGIGEHDARSRAEILEGLEEMGIRVDPVLNDAEIHDPADMLRAIHASESRSRVFVVPSREDLMIAVHVARMRREATA